MVEGSANMVFVGSLPETNVAPNRNPAGRRLPAQDRLACGPDHSAGTARPSTGTGIHVGDATSVPVDDASAQALFEQAGVIRVESLPTDDDRPRQGLR
jgi:hypothetical protein